MTLSKALALPLFLGFACLFAFTPISAQSACKKADKEFELHAFELAMGNYNLALAENPSDVDAQYKLGLSYWYLGKFLDASNTFTTVVGLSGAPADAHYYLGLTQMNLGKYGEAAQSFATYATQNPTVGAHYKSMAEFAEANRNNPVAYKINNEYLNKPADDFLPTFVGDNIVYMSTRKDIRPSLAAKGGANPLLGVSYQQLLLTGIDNNDFLKQPTLLRSDLAAVSNRGPISYSADNSVVVYAVNNYRENIRMLSGSGGEMRLYTAKSNMRGDWDDQVPFPHNATGYSTGFPALSADGNTLFFASNRQGGYGGYDIYVSQRQGNTWSTPQNLGPTVNSIGDEISPYFDGANLFFSSTYHYGFGGYDVFRAQQENGFWGKVENMGTGINSAADDIGFVYRGSIDGGYFSSNRKGGKGGLDIYRFRQQKDPFTFQVKDGQGRPISGATLEFEQCGSGLGSYNTEASGQLVLAMEKVPNCVIRVIKLGYETVEVAVNPTVLQIGVPMVIEMSTTQSDVFYGLLRQGKDNAPVVGAQVTAVNTATQQELKSITDARGKYELDMKVGNTYLIRASIPDYKDLSRFQLIKPETPKNLGILDMVPSGTYVEQTGSYVVRQSKAAMIPAEDILRDGAGAYADRGQTASTRKELEESGTNPVKMVQKITYDPVPPSPEPIIVNTPSSGSTQSAVEEYVSGSRTGSTYAATPARPGAFAIQIASVQQGAEYNLQDFQNKVGSIGTVYSVNEGGRVKIRVGNFSDRATATNRAKQLSAVGYNGAFTVESEYTAPAPAPVVTQAPQPTTATPAPAPSNASGGKGAAAAQRRTAENTTTTAVPKSTEIADSAPLTLPATVDEMPFSSYDDLRDNYAIQLAAYRTTKFFEPQKVYDLGVLSRIKKGDLSVMVLSGYKTQSMADAALRAAKDKGFTGAHLLMKDSAGTWIRVK